MLRSDLCDYSDVYIVVKETIDLSASAANENDKAEKNFAFKNNAPFRSCISKTLISKTLIGNLEELDIAMLIYNLLEYSQNYTMTSGSLWNHYRVDIDIINDNASDGRSFKYKAKIIGKTPESQNDQEIQEMQIDQLNQ